MSNLRRHCRVRVRPLSLHEAALAADPSPSLARRATPSRPSKSRRRARALPSARRRAGRRAAAALARRASCPTRARRRYGPSRLHLLGSRRRGTSSPSLSLSLCLLALGGVVFPSAVPCIHSLLYSVCLRERERESGSRSEEPRASLGARGARERTNEERSPPFVGLTTRQRPAEEQLHRRARPLLAQLQGHPPSAARPSTHRLSPLLPGRRHHRATLAPLAHPLGARTRSTEPIQPASTAARAGPALVRPLLPEPPSPRLPLSQPRARFADPPPAAGLAPRQGPPTCRATRSPPPSSARRSSSTRSRCPTSQTSRRASLPSRPTTSSPSCAPASSMASPTRPSRRASRSPSTRSSSSTRRATRRSPTGAQSTPTAAARASAVASARTSGPPRTRRTTT